MNEDIKATLAAQQAYADRLRACAPRLLAALKAYVANDEGQGLDDDEMYAEAVAAIKEAEGS